MSKWRSLPNCDAPGPPGAPAPSKTGLVRLWPAVAVAAVCAIAYARTLAPGVTWANGGLDSGDLITAAVTGGVAHPPGYPTFLLLAELALLLPLADPAVTVTTLSAAAATLATLALFDAASRWGPPAPRRAAAAALAALAFGLSPLCWSQAVIAEVYGLNALFAALLLHATLARARGAPASPPRLAATSALAGAALGNHLTILPAALVWLLVVSRADGRLRPRRLALHLGWAAAGSLVYLALPLRAAGAPPVSWGGAAGWEGFWWLVTGRLYAGLAFGLPLGELPGRISGAAAILVAQLGWAGLALGVYGLIFVCGRSPIALWGTLIPAAANAAFAIGYNTGDSQVYLLPTILAFALWVGLGAADLLSRPALARPRRAALALAALALALLWQAPSTARAVDASQDRRAIRYALAVLEQAPAGALILTSTDRDTFPLWYYHFGLGRRPDLTLVTGPLLAFPWYRESLRAAYPDLRLPEQAPAGWEAALAAAMRAGAPHCRTLLTPAPHLACGPTADGYGL